MIRFALLIFASVFSACRDSTAFLTCEEGLTPVIVDRGGYKDVGCGIDSKRIIGTRFRFDRFGRLYSISSNNDEDPNSEILFAAKDGAILLPKKCDGVLQTCPKCD
jgi:hypothetical protein